MVAKQNNTGKPGLPRCTERARTPRSTKAHSAAKALLQEMSGSELNACLLF
jgi:hypothetical protein